MKSAAGKFETYYIDRNTGTAHKVLCGGVCGKVSSNSGKKEQENSGSENHITDYEY